MERKRYTLSDVVTSRFYQVPKFLFEGELKNLSNDARMLYALLKDRHELSIQNRWVDENKDVYLIYTRLEMQEMLGLSEKTVIKAVKDLKKYKLIEEERRGLGKPNKIYLLTIVNSDFPQNRKIYGSGTVNFDDSRTVKFTVPEPENLRPNDTDLSDTDFNDIVVAENAPENLNTAYEQSEYDDIAARQKQTLERINLAAEGFSISAGFVAEICAKYDQETINAAVDELRKQLSQGLKIKKSIGALLRSFLERGYSTQVSNKTKSPSKKKIISDKKKEFIRTLYV